VVEVQAVDVNVTNLAELLDANGVLIDSNSAVLTLHPYEGFSKDINDVNGTADPLVVPIHTDIHWWLLIHVENIAGDNVNVMGEVVVTDRLGGDLELDDVNSVSQGSVSPFGYTKKGKQKGGETEKHHITWTIGNLNNSNDAQLILEISTDINPGQKGKGEPKNEYTETGTHCLNSGAVLKFIDVAGTGFKLSAHTPEICVEAVLPE
jgi:hypothetical protein